ncbi:hypothetical protein M1506_03020 [Patescibacteria group bacterium]|nr:hypothetical protein [Patescibacteria group bacterium]
MNKKVAVISVLSIIALVVLWMYSFGPLSGPSVVRVNPSSLRSTLQQSAVGSQKVTFSVYHNRDLAENFYTVKFPQTWQLQPSSTAGSYSFTFSNGSGSAGLQDVADNTTLELFVLSQEEPGLKKTLSNYQRISYQKISVNGNDAYQLVYRSAASSTDYETVKTYITGQDHAGVVTLTAKQSDFANLQPLFMSILDSFQWEK